MQTFVFEDRSSVNVIYLHTHDSGRYLDAGNAPISMPNLASLAAASMTFRNAFCAAPTCSPSRSALLTGQWPHENGMTGLAHRGFALENPKRHLVHQLRRAGYETVLCGVQHVASDRSLIGYERLLDGPEDYFKSPETSPDDWDRGNAEGVLTFLAEPRDRPFFLSFGLLSTHRPFPADGDDPPEHLAPPPPPGVPDSPETRSDTRRFHASLRLADEIVGQVCRSLRSRDLWDDTAILLTTDHGPAFPGMKCTLSDAGIGVSLVIRIPGRADGGAVNASLVSHIDLYATILELAGVEPEDRGRGRSLLELIDGRAAAIRDAVFAEINYHAAYEPSRCVRTPRYKYVRRFGDRRLPLPVNVDDSPAKELLGKAGYFAVEQAEEELYDLMLDPRECRNLLPDARGGRIHRELAARLDKWMKRTGDPLLAGPVPAPAGAKLNRTDAWSATEEVYEP